MTETVSQADPVQNTASRVRAISRVWHLTVMRRRIALLRAMRERLRELENLKLIGPSDLVILGRRRPLRHRIAKLEREHAENAHRTHLAYGLGSILL
jgi:hypothetical protein